MRSQTERTSSGFTLIEVLVVVVLVAVILASAINVLATNQRTHLSLSTKVQMQQALRAGIEVLSGELREISVREGDLVSMGRDSITLRGARTFGLVCDVSYVSGTLKVMKVGDWFAVGDSVAVLADNDPSEEADDVWKVEFVTAIDTVETCSNGSTAQRLTMSGMTLGAPPDSLSLGTPIRSFGHRTYSLHSYLGEYYLGQRAATGSTQPMLGPLAENGLSFEYLDDTGTATAVATAVAEIRVTLRTDSPVVVQGSPLMASVSASISVRN